MSKLSRIVAYIKQPSTLKGLTALAGLAGYTLAPETIAVYMLVLPVLVGLFEVARDEDKKEK